jgi:hypothetical protein
MASTWDNPHYSLLSDSPHLACSAIIHQQSTFSVAHWHRCQCHPISKRANFHRLVITQHLYTGERTTTLARCIGRNTCQWFLQIHMDVCRYIRHVEDIFPIQCQTELTISTIGCRFCPSSSGSITRHSLPVTIRVIRLFVPFVI